MRSLALLVILIPSAFILIFFIVKSLLFPQHIEALPRLIKVGRIQTAIRAKREEMALDEQKTVLNLGIAEKSIPEIEFRDLLARFLIRQNVGEGAS